MTKKTRFSKKILYLIENIWLCFSLIITLIIKDTYHLNLWIVLCIGGPLLIMGQTLIRRWNNMYFRSPDEHDLEK